MNKKFTTNLIKLTREEKRISDKLSKLFIHSVYKELSPSHCVINTILSYSKALTILPSKQVEAIEVVLN